jgi:hypothetical protein
VEVWLLVSTGVEDSVELTLVELLVVSEEDSVKLESELEVLALLD